MKFLDFLNESTPSIKQQWIEKAKEAIEADAAIVYDVAEKFGQQVDNIKHMKWFIRELALQMAEDKGENPYERSTKKKTNHLKESKEPPKNVKPEDVKHTQELINASARAATTVVADTKVFLKTKWNDPKYGFKQHYKTFDDYMKDHHMQNHTKAALTEFKKMLDDDVEEMLTDMLKPRK
jgi:hypothetical protein